MHLIRPKVKVCENIKEIGPVAICASLGVHYNKNRYTIDITFFFGIRGPKPDISKEYSTLHFFTSGTYIPGICKKVKSRQLS